MNSAPRIHIWIPDYETAMGGIQTFSRFFVQAVGDCLPEARVGILSKNDHSFPVLPAHGRPTEFFSSGWWPEDFRTPAFSSQLVLHALREKPDLILTTHVNFAPVAAWLKKTLGIPFAAGAHGVDVWGIQRKRLVHALHSANRVLAVSQHTRQRLYVVRIPKQFATP